MAKMIPTNLSLTTKSNAEKKLFDIFAQYLSEDYIVFHGPWWQHINYSIQDREADFIIIHPDKGILVVEVKGGAISYDSVDTAWYTNDKKLKKSPFSQVREIKYAFLDLIKKHDSFKKIKICIGQCVIFPDVDEVINGLPSEAPQAILLLRPHLNNISQCISSIFNYYAGKEALIPLGEERTNFIINLISPSSKFKKYIANDIRGITQEIHELTEQQFNILNYLCLHQKSIILGCAGSGKTQLAIEKARRLCQHQKKTLVICKSNYLSLYLKSSLQQEIKSGYYVVSSYEDIQAKKSQVKFHFQAIIVDEGQDFESQEIQELNKFIPNDGIFYIFQDNNQNISKNADEFVLHVSPIPLTKNCRNTDKIFKYAQSFVKCSHQIESSLIQGIDVFQRIDNNTDELFKMLGKDIAYLVNKENISPSQIVVLTDMHPPGQSILSGYSHINSFDLNQYSFSDKNKNTIQWSNIGMYKGLESDVIMLFLEKPKTLIPNKWDIVNKYIGATRAKSVLFIYESPDPDFDF